MRVAGAKDGSRPAETEEMGKSCWVVMLCSSCGHCEGEMLYAQCSADKDQHKRMSIRKRLLGKEFAPDISAECLVKSISFSLWLAFQASNTARRTHGARESAAEFPLLSWD